jgi:hypothetical protein
MRVILTCAFVLCVTGASATQRDVVDAVAFDKCAGQGGGARAEWLTRRQDRKAYDKLFPRFVCR